MRGIISYGAYVPRDRLSREAIRDTLPGACVSFVSIVAAGRDN
jgi:hypothetical protein